MRVFRYLITGLILAAMPAALAQIVVTGGATRSPPSPLNVPRIVQIPTDDFVWHWGVRPPSDDPRLGDFSVYGTEEKFFCQLSGSFEAISQDGVRGLKNDLEWASPYFIQEATARMNRIFDRVATGESWATLDCAVPSGPPTDEATQEAMAEALERAERQRDRRREREAE